MGTSPGETENGGIDETVGRLVWVRRRNGSWWPGQIMNVDELPKSCLLAVKPGTPVRLLGRDDASVDWYNLNKSKRVKAFRCGEFDNCIERAKAAVSITKKSVKYARREDAIICALAIESSYEIKDNSGLHNSAQKHKSNISTDLPVINENGEAGDELTASLKKGNLVQELAKHGFSSAEPIEISVAKRPSVKGKPREMPSDSEDDGIVGVKRMRGIKGLVLDATFKIRDEFDGEIDQLYQENADKGNSIACESPANSRKSITPSLKKKRYAVANGSGHESKRRKDRRRTLTKVLEESVMVSVPVTCNELSGIVGSHLMVGSDREAVEYMDSEGITSDFTNNCVEEADGQYENGVLSDCFDVACNPSHDDRKESRSANFLLSLDSGSSDELYDVHISMDDDNDGFTPTVPSGPSSKRHIHCTKHSEPSERVADKPVTNGDVPESDYTCSAAAHEVISYEMIKICSKWQSKRKRNSRRSTKHKKLELKNIEGVLIKKCSVQLLGLEQCCGGFSEGYDLKIGSRHEEITEDPENGFSNWGKRASNREIIEGTPDKVKDPTRSLPYRHSRFLCPPQYEEAEADFPARNTRLESSLHDVRVEVKSTYRSHLVPIVSFMSKFNGKAIIGHPLTVEIMESGNSDNLLKQFSDNPSYKHRCKPRSAKGRDPRKHSTSRNGSRNGGAYSKKTRRLSALTGSRKLREEDRNPVVEKPRSSAIACIPLIVIFSRLNEAVHGLKHIFRTPSNL